MTGSHYVTQVGLELEILPQLPGCCVTGVYAQ